MRKVCHIFFTTIILLEILLKSATGNENDGNGAMIDANFVESDGADDLEGEEEEQPIIKKERSKGVKNFVGTNLFGDTSGSPKNCFTSEDVALLAARRDFESLIPKDLPNYLLDDDLARLLMQYFYGASQVIDKMTRGHSKSIANKAFYDTLGGYLNYYMIPISKYSFYGGLIKLKTVESIIELFSESKRFLNTNGNGWRDPIRDFSDFDLEIEPLRIIVDKEDDDTSCTQLDMLDDERSGEDDSMLVALPRLEPEEKGLLRNLWLPFRRKRTFDLQSSKSAFVLLRYFELTTKCYKFQNVDQELFNKRFKNWILENVEIHLKDDLLYPGLGAVLRIIETLRRKRGDSFVIESKTKEKRQRTHENLKKIKSFNSKQIGNSGNVLKSIFESDSPVAPDSVSDKTLTQKAKDSQRKKYIYIAIGVSVCLVLIVFSVIGFTMCRKGSWRKSNTDDTLPPEPKKTGWFCCKKEPKDDEETLLHSKKSSDKTKSKKFSKKPGKPTKLQQQQQQKSEPTTCCGVCSNKNSPAIIETSSMDSDSGRDNKNKLKSSPSKPVKAITVNEKKAFSISKKNKNKDGAAKVGILKKGT
ncbi:uncharacterized protein LOC129938815 isoform X2 [Eupeodes corollae]|uniref:uncharacterized protein LOC129938815 isoform X2 n=1 Tax=Eupeodes corollae TaxID=290404 RepID=UPI0024903D0B|nr:uncharacterized protein LOC129938815 isoform X2 [Eupeodes corollae]